MYKIFSLYFLLFSCSLSAQIINVEDRRMKHADTVATYGFADFGFNIFKNDKRLVTTRTTLQAEHQRFRHIFMLVGGHGLIHTEGVQNIQNEAFTHFRYNYRLPKLWTFEAYTQVQYNERTRSKLRALVGSGMRLRLHQGKSNRFYIGTAMMYENSAFQDTELVNRDWRLSSYFSTYLKLSSQVSFAQTTYFQPLVRDLSNSRLSAEGVFIINLSKHLKFQSRGNVSFDNDPRLPEKIPDWVYSWTNGLRIDF